MGRCQWGKGAISQESRIQTGMDRIIIYLETKFINRKGHWNWSSKPSVMIPRPLKQEEEQPSALPLTKPHREVDLKLHFDSGPELNR